MTDVAALVFFGVLVVSGPSGEALAGADQRSQMIRCRPAPYFVVNKGQQRLRPQRTILTGTRVPMPRYQDRRARPCHLMHAPTPPGGHGFLKVADD